MDSLTHGGPGSGRYPKGSGKKNEIHFKVKEHKKSGEIVYTFKNDKNRHDRKIDSVAAMMDAYVAYKANYDMFF